MIDKGLYDYKVIAVTACDPRYDDVNKLDDVADFTLKEIRNFFEEYKKLEGYEVKVEDYHGKVEALQIVEQCKQAYIDAQGKCTCPSDLPYCVCGYKSHGKIITKKPIEPSEVEIQENSA